MKNTLNRIKDKLDIAKEKVCKLENISKTLSKMKGREKKENSEDSTSDSWGNFKQPNVCDWTEEEKNRKNYLKTWGLGERVERLKKYKLEADR